MRCKKHLPDLSSTVGVCASCLRERLQALLEAQAQAQPSRSTSRAASSDDHHRFGKPEPEPDHPPPLDFPRSVSPYVSRRKSDFDRRRERLFHSTPQVEPGFPAPCDRRTASSSKRRLGRFWILSSLFRARSNKMENSSRESCEPSSSASPPPSWLSTIVHARRHGHDVNNRRRCRQSDRGASPAVAVTEYEINGRDRSGSGCSSESSPQRRHHTTAVAARRSRFGPAGKSLTSMALCLSPLVRASPNRHWGSHKGLAQELGAGGTHHISTAASFCTNRSRKLADFGRAGHNR